MASNEAPRWVRWVPWVSVAAFTTLWVARWPLFPLLLDPYYHLFIARQIVDAGGPITYEWWEFAPIGRPHLYPPVVHLLLAGLLALRCPPIVAIRLLTVLIAPALVITVYRVARRLFGSDVAVATLGMALMPFSWVFQTSHGLASGLASITLLWLLVSLQEGRWIAATCLTALLCYTHLGLPWIALASVVWCALLGAFAAPRRALGSVACGLLLGSPWLIHVWRHAHWLHVTRRVENETIDVLPLLYLLALVGAWRCWRSRGAPRLLLGLWLGFCLMAYTFTFRWLSGEGVLPIILLAGFGLAWLAGQLQHLWHRVDPSTRTTAFPRLGSGQVGRGLARDSAPWAERKGPRALPVGLHGRWIGILALSAVVALSPSVLMTWNDAPAPTFLDQVGVNSPPPSKGLRVLWPDTTWFHLLNWAGVDPKAEDIQLYNPHTERLASVVGSLSQPGEILWTNAAYVGGLLGALSHRALSCAMLYEVGPATPLDPIAAAHLIVWFKIGPFPDLPALSQVIHRYHLALVGEQEIALIFRQAGVTQHAHAPHAVIPWSVAFVLSCSFIGLSVWELHRRTSAL